jgi:putative Flp pilus-assembly TadE/G-like protein
MRRQLPRRGPRDEAGATLVIVVLSLMALFGIMVLVIDVGGLLYARRAMVNGSDAAALAAAQSCANTTDFDDPEAFADINAAANAIGVVTAGTNITESVNCDSSSSSSGYVSVEYGKRLQLFFAPILGLESSNPVTTAATAHWGPAGAGHPLPIVVNEGALQGNCAIPDVEPGATCYVWEDNDILSGGNFGFLDVGDQWNVDAGYSCNDSGGRPDIEHWVDGSDPIAVLPLNYPYATYVCQRSGNKTPVWRALELLEGQYFDFPINGVSPADGATLIANPGGTTEKYNIIGFAHLQLLDVLDAKDSDPQACKNVPIPGTANPPLDLIAMGKGHGCPIALGGKFVPGSAHATPGSITMSVTDQGVIQSWSARPNKVTFDYTVPLCGDRPAPNSSGHCLVLKWNGASIGGFNPGGGADFGLRAVALCDLRIGSCLDPN